MTRAAARATMCAMRVGASEMRALCLTCLAGALWGTVGVATQLMSGNAALAPGVSALSRTGLGALVLLCAVPLLRPAEGSGPLPWALLALFGVAGAAFQVTLFAGYTAVGVTITVIVTACLPVVLVAAWDTAVARRPPDAVLAGAILLAGAGVVLAALGSDAPPAATGSRSERAGLALVTASAVAFAIVAIAGRTLGARLHPLRASGLGLAATAIVLAAGVGAGALTERMAFPIGLGLPARDLLLLGYVGVVATGGAYLAFVTGLSLARSATAGLAATLIEPAVATALAALVLREQMTAPAVTGCLMIVAGMLALSLGEWRWRPRLRRTHLSIQQEEPS
jgi:DME family drug/metabolite transporter